MNTDKSANFQLSKFCLYMQYVAAGSVIYGR
nr:MAG TPA: hypothetical protein [Bacteriophage sp.]